MSERPILLNSEMVRAVLDGRKSQTRRAIDWRRTRATEIAEKDDGSKWPWSEDCENGGDYWHDCPFGAVGHRLWVRETWSADFANYYPNDRVWYAADNDRRLDIEILDGVRGIYSPESDVHVPFRWRPSIHMPRWASRITLEITGVRVERLQDISQADAKAEGLAEITKDGSLFKFGIPDGDGYPGTDDKGWPWHEWERNPVDAYCKLWQSIYGEESWQANSWVWVIEFKRVEVSGE